MILFIQQDAGICGVQCIHIFDALTWVVKSVNKVYKIKLHGMADKINCISIAKGILEKLHWKRLSYPLRKNMIWSKITTSCLKQPNDC